MCNWWKSNENERDLLLKKLILITLCLSIQESFLVVIQRVRLFLHIHVAIAKTRAKATLTSLFICMLTILLLCYYCFSFLCHTPVVWSVPEYKCWTDPVPEIKLQERRMCMISDKLFCDYTYLEHLQWRVGCNKTSSTWSTYQV